MIHRFVDGMQVGMAPNLLIGIANTQIDRWRCFDVCLCSLLRSNDGQCVRACLCSFLTSSSTVGRDLKKKQGKRSFFD